MAADGETRPLRATDRPFLGNMKESEAEKGDQSADRGFHPADRVRFPLYIGRSGTGAPEGISEYEP